MTSDHHRTIFRAAIAAIAALSLLSPGQRAIAQESNFGSFSLNPKTRGAIVDGATGGSTSLSAVTSNLDRNENQCFGFGDPRPDHILSLGKAVDRLKIQVDSGGQDTTIVIQAPDGSFICADDFGTSKDAGMESLTSWQAGKYQVWIGTVAPSRRYNYKLTVQAN
jgi:hypothetical protein